MKEPAMFSRFDNQSTGPVNMIWPRQRTTFSPALQDPAQKAGHCFLINSAEDIRRSFLWDSSKDTGFPNNNIQRFLEERVWEGKTHCTFLLFGWLFFVVLIFFMIHTSTAERTAESLPAIASCQGMVSLLQISQHTSFNLYLVTSNDKDFPKPTRLNFEVKDLASRICFLDS